MKKLLYILLFVPLALFGQENYSLSFDGVDDYVIIENNGSDLFQNHTQFSISANVKFNSNSVWGVIAEHHESYWEGTINPNQTVGWYLRRNAESENIHFNFHTSQGNISSIESSVIIPLNEWVNVTGVFNAENSKIYINGEDVTYNQSEGEDIGAETLTPTPAKGRNVDVTLTCTTFKATNQSKGSHSSCTSVGLLLLREGILSQNVPDLSKTLARSAVSAFTPGHPK